MRFAPWTGDGSVEVANTSARTLTFTAGDGQHSVGPGKSFTVPFDSQRSIPVTIQLVPAVKGDPTATLTVSRFDDTPGAGGVQHFAAQMLIGLL
jgi:hypothetical protein